MVKTGSFVLQNNVFCKAKTLLSFSRRIFIRRQKYLYAETVYGRKKTESACCALHQPCSRVL